MAYTTYPFSIFESIGRKQLFAVALFYSIAEYLSARGKSQFCAGVKIVIIAQYIACFGVAISYQEVLFTSGR